MEGAPWQREICAVWSEGKCTAGSEACEGCLDFRPGAVKPPKGFVLEREDLSSPNGWRPLYRRPEKWPLWAMEPGIDGKTRIRAQSEEA